MTSNLTDTEKYALLDSFIDEQDEPATALIAVLHKAQELFEYLPTEVQIHIAEQLKIPAAKVFGVVTFYSYFSTKPRGKYKVSICLGTACFVKGAHKIHEELHHQLKVGDDEITDDGLFSIHPVRCIGACGLAPAVIINDTIHGRLDVPQVSKLLDVYRAKEDK